MAERLEEIVAERRLGEVSSAYSFYEQMLHNDQSAIVCEDHQPASTRTSRSAKDGVGDAASTLEQVLISYWRLDDSTSLAA